MTAEAKHLAKMAGVAEPAAVDDATRVVTTETPGHRADAGMGWGTLIHGLLEHAMRHPRATGHDLQRLGIWLVVEQPELRPLIDQAVATVQAVATAAFWPDAQAGEHSVEVPFAIARRDRELSMGVIDLLYRAQGIEWRVVDYKTDVTLDAAAELAYDAQLDAYRQALAACGLEHISAALRHVRARRDLAP